MGGDVQAHLAEVLDADEHGHLWATGRFLASVQSHEDGVVIHPPEALRLRDAVAWARGHAARVLVRVHDCEECSFYSAGRVALDGVPALPQTLELSPRRAPGWEFPDRSVCEEPIDWDVKVIAGQGRGAPVADYPRLFARYLQSDPTVRCVEWIAYAGGGGEQGPPAAIAGRSLQGFVIGQGGNSAAGARLRVTAATAGEAEALAEAAATRAGRAALAQLEIEVGDGPLAWQWAARAFPADTRVARSNASLRLDGTLG